MAKSSHNFGLAASEKSQQGVTKRLMEKLYHIKKVAHLHQQD